MLIYGVCISDIATINEEKAISFSKKYAKTDPNPLEEFMGSGDSNGDLLPFEEWVRYYEYNGYYGLSAFLAEIINTLEKIDISCDDMGGMHYLGIRPDMPWNYNEKTKELTKDQYIKIMDKYINEFTDSHLSMEWWFVEDD